MTINQENLKLLKYLQEKNNAVTLNETAAHFHKNTTSIRREIEAINSSLKTDKKIEIHNGKIYQHLNYTEYTRFIKSLKVYEYTPSILERLQVIIIKIFFNDIVNLSNFYQELGISLTTKKSDRKKLDTYLQTKSLSTMNIHKKGICIIGDEIRFRILAVQLMLPLIEVDENYILTPRKANTPYEQLIVSHIEDYYPQIQTFCKLYIEEFLTEYHHSLTYSSKKFILLYTAFSILRKGKHCIQKDYQLPVQPLNLYFFPDHNENQAFNHVIAMLDVDPAFDFPFNETLNMLCSQFVSSIEADIITNFHTYNEIVKEVYNYMYKQVVCITYEFTFYDKMVRNTSIHISALYQLVKKHVHIFEQHYAIQLADEQLSTLTLVLKKWIQRNKISGRNRKKIIIVTNTSFERISYFVEMLKEQIECKLVKVLNINELDKISHIDHDAILTFSDRIQDIVTNLGYTSIKLNYFICNEDIDLLLMHGFSKLHQHILAEDFGKLLHDKDQSTIEALLKDMYPDLFI